MIIIPRKFVRLVERKLIQRTSTMQTVSPASAPWKRLNDGNSMPGIALGTFLGKDPQGAKRKPIGDEVENAVKWAIDAGYRHIDTAHIYMVEDQVGRAIASKIKDGTVTREDIFVTSKLYRDSHARDRVVPALRESLDKLGLEYLDLYLIHWPLAVSKDGTFETTDYMETWEGMQEAKRLGLTRSVGVSNFNATQLSRVLRSSAKPAVLQVEVNLNLQQRGLLEFAHSHNVTVMGYTPFGSLFAGSSSAPPPRVDDPPLVAMASKYNKTVPQVVLRYMFELGVVPLPKSAKKNRIEQNIDIFDFELDNEDKSLLKSYDCNYRVFKNEDCKNHPHYPFNE